jgi:predicted RNA-binding Zn ribbon-like protein
MKPLAIFLAGDPALDFLNTRMRVNQELVDSLQSDNDVLAWLREAGFPVPVRHIKMEPLLLLRSARKLRESTRVLVEMRKAGRRGDPQILNGYLAAGENYSQLAWRTAHSLKIDIVWRQDTPGSILAPVAKAAAELLAFADFELIKRCEDESCVFWFSDQTKSHNRRWCSTQRCGNRHKVAAYRKRRRERNTLHG